MLRGRLWTPMWIIRRGGGGGETAGVPRSSRRGGALLAVMWLSAALAAIAFSVATRCVARRSAPPLLWTKCAATIWPRAHSTALYYRCNGALPTTSPARPLFRFSVPHRASPRGDHSRSRQAERQPHPGAADFQPDPAAGSEPGTSQRSDASHRGLAHAVAQQLQPAGSILCGTDSVFSAPPRVS